VWFITCVRSKPEEAFISPQAYGARVTSALRPALRTGKLSEPVVQAGASAPHVRRSCICELSSYLFASAPIRQSASYPPQTPGGMGRITGRNDGRSGAAVGAVLC
jgi:hypothetical protein